MRGDGVDINILSRNIDKDFQWNTNFLFNYNTSKTTKYLDPVALTGIRIVGSDGNTITPVVGKPLYAIAAYRWGGLDASGNPQGYLNGQLSTDYLAMNASVGAKGISGNDIIYVGPATPVFFGSLINMFELKGFSLSFNISYKLGYYFKKSFFSAYSLINSGTGHSDYVNRWQKPGDELITNVPVFVYPWVAPPGNANTLSDRESFYGASEINVLKADHLRLEYINLGYSLTNKKMRLPFEQIQLYGNVANLGIIWQANKEKIDPDYPVSVPPSISFTIGLKANF